MKTAAGTGPGIGGFPTSTNNEEYAWLEWNAHFRDWWRGIVNNDDWVLSSDEGGVDGGGSLTGSYATYGWNGRSPYHAINFVTVHDGFTMYDLFSYDEKQNGCGLLNPVCCDNPKSVWCDSTSGDASLGGDRDASPAGGTAAEPPPIPQRISSALCLGRGEWAAWELCACVCVEQDSCALPPPPRCRPSDSSGAGALPGGVLIAASHTAVSAEKNQNLVVLV